MIGIASRGRRFTPEEAAQLRQTREQAQAEKAEIVGRLQTEQRGPATWADFHELRSLVGSLRAEREKRGLTREEVAHRAMLDVRQIVELEEHRDLNPSLSTLTRFAMAVGRHLMLGLAAGTPIRADLPIHAQSSAFRVNQFTSDVGAISGGHGEKAECPNVAFDCPGYFAPNGETLKRKQSEA